MNANELSDWLVAFTESNVDYEEKIVLESATMLRQQQRTIDGDKRLIDLLYEKVEKLQAEIEALKAKTLTDEEIEAIYEEFFGFKPKDKYAVEFSRATLRKANEK